MKLLSFGPGHVDSDGTPSIIRADNFYLGLVAHGKNRMLWRNDFPAADREKNVSWLNASK